jgi:Fe-S cluster biogenesis protein NfuA
MSSEQLIKEVLTNLQPMIQAHGGAIEFAKFEDDTVYVKLHGACVGCPISLYTLKFGIEEAIREKIPSVKQVIALE